MQAPRKTLVEIERGVSERLSANFPEFEDTTLRAFYTLRATASRLNSAVNAWLDDEKLTAKTINLLAALYSQRDGKPLLVGEIGLASDVPGSTLTAMLDALEARGLIRRSSPGEDKRRILVGLTAKGKRFFEKAFAMHLGYTNRVFAPLSVEERKTLIALLLKVNAGIDQALQEPAEQPA